MWDWESISWLVLTFVLFEQCRGGEFWWQSSLGYWGSPCDWEIIQSPCTLSKFRRPSCGSPHCPEPVRKFASSSLPPSSRNSSGPLQNPRTASKVLFARSCTAAPSHTYSFTNWDLQFVRLIHSVSLSQDLRVLLNVDVVQLVFFSDFLKQVFIFLSDQVLVLLGI